MPWTILHRLSTKNHRQIESNPLVQGPAHLGGNISPTQPYCKFTRPDSASLGFAFSLMPQGGIKLSKQKRSKMPKKMKSAWLFFEKSLKDTAFILSESS
jgi:hypothetical protein